MGWKIKKGRRSLLLHCSAGIVSVHLSAMNGSIRRLEALPGLNHRSLSLQLVVRHWFRVEHAWSGPDLKKLPGLIFARGIISFVGDNRCAIFDGVVIILIEDQCAVVGIFDSIVMKVG